MSDGIQLASALASLRDSLARLSTRLDSPQLAVRATRARIRANEAMKKLAAHLAAGTLPSVPDDLVKRVFEAGGLVSLANPDNEGAVTEALKAAEAVLAVVEKLVG
ncbi:hypothetical protein [Sandaracinobacteroides hominis]|uniref:hypothetical protein n=1 Tax=Sandaracinobacteroides hominis TaxID=2780086 RepID=UPI0018F5604A|nr:hypothetical protein [Sandaracinobacteroides hominis]